MKPQKHHQTPLEKLYIERNLLRAKYKQEQTRITEDWEYIRSNKGYLIFSGLRDLVFPHRHKKQPSHDHHKESFWQNVENNLPFYLATLRQGLSVMWYVLRPFYIKWVMTHRR